LNYSVCELLDIAGWDKVHASLAVDLSIDGQVVSNDRSPRSKRFTYCDSPTLLATRTNEDRTSLQRTPLGFLVHEAFHANYIGQPRIA